MSYEHFITLVSHVLVGTLVIAICCGVLLNHHIVYIDVCCACLPSLRLRDASVRCQVKHIADVTRVGKLLYYVVC